MIRARAAVAWAAGEPLDVTEIDVAPPQAGEVLLKVVATGVCHTDAYTLSGADPEGLFPTVLGHEGGAVVVEIGEGVSSVAVGDHVIPLYTPECGSRGTTAAASSRGSEARTAASATSLTLTAVALPQAISATLIDSQSRPETSRDQRRPLTMTD